MSQPLGFVVSADTSSLLAKMVEAGQITQTQASKMQRALQFVSRELQSMAQAQKAATDITGAAAAMALPPQIAVPTPSSTATLGRSASRRPRAAATSRVPAIPARV